MNLQKDQPFHPFISAFLTIFFCEIGDRTFWIAVLMAAEHNRALVFSAAATAITVITITSAWCSTVILYIIPGRIFQYIAAGGFLICGASMLYRGYNLTSSSTDVSEEALEAIAGGENFAARTLKQQETRSFNDPEARLPNPLGLDVRTKLLSLPQSRKPAPFVLRVRTRIRKTIFGIQNILSFLFSPVWMKTFLLTFVGELGDRSQMAVVMMAANKNLLPTTMGAVLGHFACTVLAVIGGKAVGKYISPRAITFGSAITFMLFGILYLVEAIS